MNCVFIENTFKQLNQFMATYWTQNNVFISVLLFSWITFIWNTYLSLRQYKIYRTLSQVPNEFRGVIDNETLSKAKDYNTDKTRFGFVADIYGQILTTCVLWFGVIPMLWSISGRVVLTLGAPAVSELTQTLVFVLFGSLLSTLTDLPISVFRTFVVEEKHGFNKQSIGFYAKDRIMKFVVKQAVIAPIVCVTVFIIKNSEKYFGLYLWAFSVALILLFITVYSDFIAPLFDSFTPLPEGQLRTNIEALARSIDFPLKNIYVVKGSMRSSHSNAYFFGFYKNKRIVLFDTLFAEFYRKQHKTDRAVGQTPDVLSKHHKQIGCTDEEILAILAHELGHWYLNHTFKYVFIAQSILFLYFMFYSVLYQNKVLYKAFGFSEQKPVFIVMCFSRHFEFGSDAFAKQLNKGPQLKSALISLYKDNLGFPVYDWLYSSWNHSHPSLLHRLKALNVKNG